MRTVAIDLGGTAVKLGVFDSGRLVAEDEFDAVDGQIGLDEVAERVESLLAGERACRGRASRCPASWTPQARACSRLTASTPQLHDLDLSAWSQCPVRMPRRRRERRTCGPHRRDHGRQRTRIAGCCAHRPRHGHRRGRGRSTATSSAGATAMVRSSAATSRVDLDGPRCPCGNIGCAEALASTWALTADAAAGDLALGPELAARLADQRRARHPRSRRDPRRARVGGHPRPVHPHLGRGHRDPVPRVRPRCRRRDGRRHARRRRHPAGAPGSRARRPVVVVVPAVVRHARRPLHVGPPRTDSTRPTISKAKDGHDDR